MEQKFNTRLLVVWVILASLTLTYLWMDRYIDPGSPSPSRVLTASVIVIALVKVRIIFREFMCASFFGSSWRCVRPRNCCAG